jgi:chaperonin cofactor prefoldin
VLLLRISFQQDIGHVRHGKMKADEVLKLLEKHEEECNRRYDYIQKQLDKLDIRLWGIAALIIATALANRFI